LSLFAGWKALPLKYKSSPVTEPLAVNWAWVGAAAPSGTEYPGGILTEYDPSCLPFDAVPAPDDDVAAGLADELAPDDPAGDGEGDNVGAPLAGEVTVTVTVGCAV